MHILHARSHKGCVVVVAGLRREQVEVQILNDNILQISGRRIGQERLYGKCNVGDVDLLHKFWALHEFRALWLHAYASGISTTRA